MGETKVKDSAKQSHKAQMRAIELEKAKIELAAAQGDFELDQIHLRSRKREASWKDADDREYGVFNLDTIVGSATVKLAAELRQWARLNPGKPITLNIFSPGGSIFHGITLYDTLRSLSRKGHPVTTVALGYAASMGSLILLAGDVRIASGEALIMFHKLSAGTGGMLYEMEDDLAFYKRLNSRLASIVTSRTGITLEVLEKKWDRTDWWIDAKTAKKLGVVDQID
jgi:ATP-dependent Clp protease protease subunit